MCVPRLEFHPVDSLDNQRLMPDLLHRSLVKLERKIAIYGETDGLQYDGLPDCNFVTPWIWPCLDV
jgi:hypothetical protein